MGLVTLTLDTNLLFEYWQNGAKCKAVEELLLLAKQGKVDLAVTARIREDIPLPPLALKLNDLPEMSINETGSVARLDHWVLDRDMLGDKEFDDFWPRAQALAENRRSKPPDWRDWDHLHTHYLLRRDIFLTWDQGIICIAEDLRLRFQIVIMRPEEYLQLPTSGVALA